MKLSIIAAIGNNNVIGLNNKLIWHIPEDLKYFKNLTTGQTVIMGRKTFEGIGKPLPNRKIIVVSRQKDYSAGGCTVANDLTAAIKEAENSDQVFIAGGAEIYKQAITLPEIQFLYITRIYACFEGDTFFPHIDDSVWSLISHHAHFQSINNRYYFAFEVYKRL